MGDSQEAEGVENQITELKEWIAKQQHVAKDMDDKLLRRFLHSCYYDMQKTQKTIETFTSIRTNTPELFADREPLGQRVAQAFKYANSACFPISGNRRLWITQINDPGFQNFDHPEFSRAMLLSLDAWLLEENKLEDGDYMIFDAKDVSIKIFWRLHLSLQKKLAKYQEEAMPLRIKQMHMLNAPSFMDKLFSILKKFMSKEMGDMVHFHVPESETLFQYFSKDDIPKDFGGNLDSLEVYSQNAIDLIHKHSKRSMGDSKIAEVLENQVTELKEWIANQPNGAKDMDDKLLRRFLHSCYYDMQKTQKTIQTYTSMRANTPELFADRDPMGQRVIQAFKFTKLAFLPISGNRRLWIFQIDDPGFQNFEHPEFIRTILLAFDAWLLEENNLDEGDYTLFDAKDVSIKIFWRLHLSLHKKLTKYQEEAMPLRIRQMHMINTPPFMDKLYSILKKFMSKEMGDMLHFHAPESDTLFQYFSKDDIPKDFGGNLDSLEVYNKNLIDLIHKHSDTLKKNDLWTSKK